MPSSIPRQFPASSRKATLSPGAVAQAIGDADRALAGAATKIEAIYQLPFLAHATMEPMNCTAHVRRDGCEIWIGNQAIARVQAAAAKAAGLPPDKVVVHNHLIGGGFGRRLEADGAARAVEIAQHVDGPVKVVWTCEEDIQHDMYRPYWFDRLSAGLDASGMPVAWKHRFAGSSVIARWLPPGSKMVSIPIAPRALSTSSMASRTCMWSMCGWSLRAFRRPSGAASGRRTTSLWPKASWTNWQPRRSKIRSPTGGLFSTSRPAPSGPRAGGGKGRLGTAPAEEDRPWHLPSVRLRHLHGAGCRSRSIERWRGSCPARGLRRRLRNHRQPRYCRAQIQSAIVFGITAALYGEITLKGGRVEQANFDTYQMLRMNEAPTIEVHIVQEHEPPGGMGEWGTSTIVPGSGERDLCRHRQAPAQNAGRYRRVETAWVIPTRQSWRRSREKKHAMPSKNPCARRSL